MTRKYRVAVIGATGKGNYGHGLDTCWLKVPAAEIVAVADEDEQGRQKAMQRLQVTTAYADYRTMLDEVRPEIVSIAPRWIDRHHEMLLAAIERGIHVFIEKPFVRTPREADEVIRAAEMRHVHVAIAHPTHYSPVLGVVRRLLREGAIGMVLELRARGKEDRRGGGEDMWVLGAHLFDMMLALGYEPEWCFATATQAGRPITPDDIVTGNEGIGLIAGDAIHARYGMPEGVMASFDSVRNAGGNPGRFGLRIHGSQGVIDIVEGIVSHVHILQASDWAGRAPQANWLPITSAGIDRPEPLVDEKYRDRNILAAEDLIRAIEQRAAPLCNAEFGRKVTEMIVAPYESIRQGKAVAMPLENREHPLEAWGVPS